MSSNKDSTKNVLIVSTLLCIVCSVIVSLVAVGLRELQLENATKDKKRNVLLAAGIIDDDFDGDLAEKFAEEGIEAVLIDLATGATVEGDADAFDMRKRMNDPDAVVPVTSDEYPAGITKRPRQVVVYLHKPQGKLTSVILPVVGQGLWSTMFGFLALEPDLRTTKGLVFYEQGETPGLGGEVDNPRWRDQFRNKGGEDYKCLFDESDGSFSFRITKAGMADQSSKHEIDGISGATITCRGVDGMIRYWMSDSGFAPYLAKLKSGGGN